MTHTLYSEVSLHSWLLWPMVRRAGGRETLNHSKSQLALVYSYKLCALVQCKPRPFMFFLSLRHTLGHPCLFVWNGVRPEASNILCFQMLSSAPVYSMIKFGVEWSDEIFHLLALLSTNDSDAGRWKTFGVPAVIGGDNLPSLVGIGLPDLPNI